MGVTTTANHRMNVPSMGQLPVGRLLGLVRTSDQCLIESDLPVAHRWPTDQDEKVGSAAARSEETKVSGSDIPKTMRASVLVGLEKIEMQERPGPQPAAGGVLMLVRSGGVCGS